MPYADLREYLQALEGHGKLHRVTREVDKDWEISAVGRSTFQRIPAARRPALLFERVKGSTIPVLVGALGASLEVYALALETTVQGIHAKWEKALANPIPPVRIPTGPCKENILMGDQVDLGKFPIPTWTAHQDPGPYINLPYVCSKDPEDGSRNVGTYRMQVKGKNKTGLFISTFKDPLSHIAKNEKLGRPTPIAVVIGADPTIGLTSVATVPRDVDEFALSGGLRGAPVELVKCETSDIEVPATAEIVLEGEIPPNIREHEGPFGEHTGYMGAEGDTYVFHIKCITHRNNPIFHGIISLLPPSESSCIRLAAREFPILKHLRDRLGLPVVDVHLKESGGTGPYLVISMKKQFPEQVKQVIWGAWSFEPTFGKIVVVVDDDIDIRDANALDWAICYRMQPQHDAFIVPEAAAYRLDPSTAPIDVPSHHPSRRIGSKLAMDATRKHEFPGVAVPPKEHLDQVWSQWEEYGFSRSYSQY